MDCSTFRRRLTDFQADELEADERLRAQAHLDACPACAVRLEAEAALLGAVKRGLHRHPAPPELRRGVRAALGREAQVGAAGRRRAWVLAVAAALALAALLGVALRGLERPRIGGEPVETVRREVLVVDQDCDRAGHDLAWQRRCTARGHVNALKTASGTYWSPSLDSAAGRRLAVDLELRGHRLMVEGELYRPIRTLRVRRVRDLGLASADTARRLRPEARAPLRLARAAGR